MVTSFSQGVIRIENLAIVTSNGEVSPWQAKEIILKKWDILSQQLDNGIVLFIAGAHGTKAGNLDDFETSCETLINMVMMLHLCFDYYKSVSLFQFESKRMKEFRGVMESRNIVRKYLNIRQFVKDGITKVVDEKRLVNEIKTISPAIIVIVICYSSTLNIKFLLESCGIFSEVRMNRDMCIQSLGKILTMSAAQKMFLQTIAAPENISKRLVKITGQVGSGKTLMGIETIKMKVAHYLRLYKLTAEEGKQQLRVFIVLELGSSQELKQHLEKEYLIDITNQATIEIHNTALSSNIDMAHKFHKLKKIVDIEERKLFRHTIIMIDECCRGFLEFSLKKGISHDDRYFVEELEKSINIDYIHCYKYVYLGEIPGGSKVENVIVNDQEIIGTFLRTQRSSKQINNLTHFFERHAWPEEQTIPHFQAEDSFDGPVPQWYEINDVKEFADYAESTLSEFNDTLIIRDRFQEKEPLIEALCLKLNWKYCSRVEVTGSEASQVIIFDFSDFIYESFTRAKHNLLIVTFVGKR